LTTKAGFEKKKEMGK